MPTDNARERRRYRRFPLSLALRYRLGSGLSGTGELLNMSSGGLFFRGGGPLPLGEMIEADISWPMRLDETKPLQLRIRGMVVRSGEEGTAVAISRYEFRTVRPRP
jgi:hypothetical protein